MQIPDKVTAKCVGLQRHRRATNIPDEYVKVEFIVLYI